MTLVAHYPDKPELVREMITLAREELAHFDQVVRLIYDRNLTLAADEKDEYVRAMMRKQRKGDAKEYLLDRLLIAGIVEARGHERFSMLAEHFQEEALRAFYDRLAKAEARHFELFIELAKKYYDEPTIAARLDVLLKHEAEVVSQLPHTCRLH